MSDSPHQGTSTRAAQWLVQNLPGRTLESFQLGRPRTPDECKVFATILSKVSPFVANLFELASRDLLNGEQGWPAGSRWERQDPDFPDLVLRGEAGEIEAGVELKAWFPLATEITGRFRESQAILRNTDCELLVVAWLPEHVLWGRPEVIAAWAGPALSVARDRDRHYFRPPGYLVLEPEDTSRRTRNLQQRNVEGRIFQGESRELEKAKLSVRGWPGGTAYDTDSATQGRIRELVSRFTYRAETNFAKIDRINHAPLEVFKRQVLQQVVCGKAVESWSALFAEGTEAVFQEVTRLS